MVRLTNEEDWAILFANLKGNKKEKIDNWITISEACQRLVKKHDKKTVATKVGISEEMIREILTVFKLTSDNKKLIKERKLDSIDKIKMLAQLKDEELQNKAGELLLDVTAHEARDILDCVKKYPNLSIEEYKNKVLESRLKIEELILTVVPFDKELFEELKKNSIKQKLSLEENIIRIIRKEIIKEPTGEK